MTTFPVTGASCHTTFNCMKSDLKTQLNNNISLPDTDIENGGFRGLSGIEKMMKCSTLCCNNSERKRTLGQIYFRACDWLKE